MTVLTYCPTANATVLFVGQDLCGILKVVTPQVMIPGYTFEIVGRVPINDQIRDYADKLFQMTFTAKTLDVQQHFHEALTLSSGDASTLYVASVLDPDVIAKVEDKMSFPEMLRKMPKNKGRLPYLKAWQILAGGLSPNTRAVEVDEIEKNLH